MVSLKINGLHATLNLLIIETPNALFGTNWPNQHVTNRNIINTVLLSRHETRGKYEVVLSTNFAEKVAPILVLGLTGPTQMLLRHIVILIRHIIILIRHIIILIRHMGISIRHIILIIMI